MQYSKHIHMTFFFFYCIYSAAWKYWPIEPQANLDFATGNDRGPPRQNGGGDNRGKFAAGEKTRHATKEKVWLAW